MLIERERTFLKIFGPLKYSIVDTYYTKSNSVVDEFHPVSIVIPTLNRPSVLLNSLKYLIKQEYPQFEIIIIDSSDQSDQRLLNFIRGYNFITYVKTERNGPSSAKNLGIQHAKNNIIIFCDDDVIPVVDFIKHHVKNYSDSNVGGIAGRVISKNDIPVEKIKKVGKIRFDGSMISNFNADFRSEVDHVYGCNMSFRRDILERIGGFSLDFPGNAYFEEADLAMRVKYLGYRLIFDPDATLTHLTANEGGVRLYLFRDWVYNYIHNYIILLKKHFHPLVFPIFLLRQGFWGIIWTIYHHDPLIPVTIIRALRDGLRDARSINKN